MMPKRVTPARFESLVNPSTCIFRPDVRPQSPPIFQTSLFPTPGDEAFAMMEQLLSGFSTKKARIKNLAKSLRTDQKMAKRLYLEALTKFVHQLRYEFCQKNAEYLAWHDSPAGAEYRRKYVEDLDASRRKWEEAFDARLSEGAEHIVEISSYDSSLLPVLDNPFFANIEMQGPVSSLLAILTENDLRILLVRGKVRIVQGDENTIFNYKFSSRTQLEEAEALNSQRARCSNCGNELTYNQIGFNEKMGIHRNYQCPACLGVEKHYINEVSRHYRSSGCHLFI